MSRYGEDRASYVKENLYDTLKHFLEEYEISEMLKIIADVVEDYEWRKNEDT